MAKDAKQRILDEALVMERDRHSEREPEIVDRIRMFKPGNDPKRRESVVFDAGRQEGREARVAYA